MKTLTSLTILIVILTSASFSQIKEGEHLLGGSLGFWTRGSTPILGVNYEYILPKAGIGNFGAGGIIRYWNYVRKYDDNSQYEYTNLVVAGQFNYNFSEIGTGVFVPYVGLVAGFNNVSEKYVAYNQTSIIGKEAEYKSGFIVWGQTGFRYFFSPKIAGSVRLGLGNLDFSTIELGIDYKF